MREPFRVVVIGGTGFLGPEVVRQLVAAGAELLLLHRGEHEVEFPSSVRHLHGDRSVLSSFSGAFRSFAPDVVIDMRPMTEDDADGMVTTFVGVARRAVVVSSSDVYRAYGRINRTEPGPPDPVPIREDAPLRGQLFADRDARPHDRAESLERYDKILVERTVSAEPRLPAAILRLGFVHGPRSYRHYQYVKSMADKRPGIVLAESWARWRGTLAYSENVAAAIALAAMREEAHGAYNVGDPEPTSNADLVAHLAGAAKWHGRIVSVPDARAPASLRPPLDLLQELVLDSSRIRTELGYRETIGAADGFRRTVEWQLRVPPGPEDPMSKLEVDYEAEDAVLREN